ncbi:tetratricopeptide repeat protein [Cystobacter ferrugineus]|uniref:Uncharacterized protein n=1 Tax=Cystobacter ferrugineus TaxID=83449 RepID=A0A1L9AVX2_9BACT|nr:tetratricopeptide repeat protein [Cystobacter ferrugineus]OJH34150.1 hypothetical protein BON30_45155 [Cystobacter ferrugineus]
MNGSSLAVRHVQTALRALAATLILCSAGPALGGDFRQALASAVGSYEQLEYERALEGLDRAEALAQRDDERAEVALHRGIVLGELSRRKAALAAFRSALTLRPTLKLPPRVAPKIERDFEAVRRSLSAAQTSRSNRSGARRAPPSDAPRVETAPEPIAAVTPPELLPALPAETPAVAPSRRLPVLPIALAGASVVAGGLGGFFGLRSSATADKAVATDIRSVRELHHSDARRQASVANVLFGVALTTAAGAAVTWLLSGSEAPDP